MVRARMTGGRLKQEIGTCNQRSDTFSREDLLLARAVVLQRARKGALPEFCSFLVPRTARITSEGLDATTNLLQDGGADDAVVEMSQNAAATTERKDNYPGTKRNEWAKTQGNEQYLNHARYKFELNCADWSQWNKTENHSCQKSHHWPGRWEDWQYSALRCTKDYGQCQWQQEEPQVDETKLETIALSQIEVTQEDAATAGFSHDDVLEGARTDSNSSADGAKRDAEEFDSQRPNKSGFVSRWRAARASQRRDGDVSAPTVAEGGRSSSPEDCECSGHNQDTPGGPQDNTKDSEKIASTAEDPWFLWKTLRTSK